MSRYGKDGSHLSTETVVVKTTEGWSVTHYAYYLSVGVTTHGHFVPDRDHIADPADFALTGEKES